MSDDSAAPQELEEDTYEMTPEEATGLNDAKPLVLNRRLILIAVTVFLSLLIGGSIIYTQLRPKKNKPLSDEELYAANSSSDFLDSLQSRALRNRENEPQVKEPEEAKKNDSKEPLLPPASMNSRAVDSVRPQPPPPAAVPQAPPSGGNNEPPSTHFKSPLVPNVEGRLFAQQTLQQPAAAANSSARAPSQAQEYFNSAAANARPSAYGQSDYAAQNGQQNKQAFYGSSDNSAAGSGSGFYIGENSLWTGTIIPGVLETAINTDLPGNVLARVSQNVYDSQTGQYLLIPQGTLLLARYNSSISYAQHRVQIVWDAMIRPDGFQINLEGANGVDRAGMSGQAAKYHENWFEYLKAAGIITLFSVANAKMTEAAAQYSTPDSAGNIAAANSAFVNQVGGNFVNRAMNIQPTLTVENGTPVNIMLNKTLYLPPVPPYTATQKYILE